MGKRYPYKIHMVKRKDHLYGMRFEWHYWNDRVERWCRYTKRDLTPDEAKIEIAKVVYGCDPDLIIYEPK